MVEELSSEAIGYVFKYSPHTGITFQVHLAIADTVNDVYRNETWFALANLADKARVSRPSAQRALAALIDSGDLIVVDPTVGADGKPTGRPGRYRMLRPVRLAAYPQGDLSAREGESPRGEGESPRGEGVHHGDAGGASPRGAGRIMVMPVTQYNPNQTQEETALPAYEFEFNRIWQAYPRKTARKAALAAYSARRAAGTSADRLLAAAREYDRRVTADRTEEKYVLHGATFFGPNERWMDYEEARPEARKSAHDEIALIQRMNENENA